MGYQRRLDACTQTPSNTATSFSDFSVRSGTTYRYMVVAGYPSGSTQTESVTVKAR